jgi:hypothetical protein
MIHEIYLAFLHWTIFSLYLSYDQITALNLPLQYFLFCPIFFFNFSFYSPIAFNKTFFHLILFKFMQHQTFPLVLIHLLHTIYGQSSFFKNINKPFTLLRVQSQGTDIAIWLTLGIKQRILNIPCSDRTEYGQRFKIYRDFCWGNHCACV